MTPKTPATTCVPDVGADTPLSQAERVAASRMADAIIERCGPLENWVQPTGYPHSLALCVLDSIYSIGVNYRAVENVVGHYRVHRAGQADTDGATQLLGVIDQLSVEGFAAMVHNHNGAWSRVWAPLKASVVHAAAAMLREQEIDTTDQLRNHFDLAQLEQQWRALPGQASGISWRYLQILARMPNVKPDRMVRRFVASALDEPRSTRTDTEIRALVIGAAYELGIHPILADHLIWQAASGRPIPPPHAPPNGIPLTAAQLDGGSDHVRVHATVTVATVALRRTSVGRDWAVADANWNERELLLVSPPHVWARHPLALGDEVAVIADTWTTTDGRPGLNVLWAQTT